MANNDQSLGLSASEVKDLTGWPDAIVDDYISRGADYMLTGSGSPEGVKASNRTRQYFDSSANQLYVNPKVGAKDGWVPV